MPLAPTLPYQLRTDDDGRLMVLRPNPIDGTYDVLGPACYDTIVRDATNGNTAGVGADGRLDVAQRKETLTARATGNAALVGFVVTLGVRWELICVKLHLSAAGGAVEDFTATLNAAGGAVYDSVLIAEDTNALTDLVWMPDGEPVPFNATDELVFAYANSNTRTYGLEVFYRAEV